MPWVLFTGTGSWAPSPNLWPEEPGYLSNWQLAGNQSGMGDPTSCCAAVGVAFMFTDACKPTHPAKICLQYGEGIIKGWRLILAWTVFSSDSTILPKCDGVIQDCTTLWIGFYFVDHVQFASYKTASSFLCPWFFSNFNNIFIYVPCSCKEVHFTHKFQ